MIICILYTHVCKKVIFLSLHIADYHGRDGPLHVNVGYNSLLADLFSTAMTEIGYKEQDCNGEDIFGITVYFIQL